MDQMFPLTLLLQPWAGRPLCTALQLQQNNKEDFTAVVGMGGGGEAGGNSLSARGQL